MREFKFRAVDTVNHNKVHHGITLLDINENNLFKKHGIRVKWKWIKWLQWTGLKDKNGKDIYEGDIVKETQTGQNHLEPYFKEIKYEKGKFNVIGERSWDSYTRWWTVEVVGNIFEDGDLLKLLR